MTADSAALPRITDRDTITVSPEPTSSTEYVVRVDVLDAVLPELLRAVAADKDAFRSWRKAYHAAAWVIGSVGTGPIEEHLAANDFVRLGAALAEVLRQHGVGVLHLTPGSAEYIAWDLDAARDPDRCAQGACDIDPWADLAGMCRIHDTDRDDLPRGEDA